MNCWTELKNKKQPIYALAPLAGITDSPFRQICKSYGADIVYSEMASVSALVYKPEKTLSMLKSKSTESPYVIQLFGSDPKQFAKATQIISSEKLANKFCENYNVPSGIDINFGCPVRKVQKQGAGAILMNDLDLSHKIIENVIGNTDLPVSIKIRTTAGTYSALEFIDHLKNLPISALMIHGRSLSQGFTGEIDYEIIKNARNYYNGIILANGGAFDLSSTQQILKNTQADGVGIARGCLGRPWIFKELKTKAEINYNINDIFNICLNHAKLVVEYQGEDGLREFRKHLCWYVQKMPGARQLRQEFIAINTLEDIKNIIQKNRPL